MDTQIFERYESAVRSYCRSFPVVFSKAKGAKLITEEGKEYIDFFAGAGALNYGHNNDKIKAALIDYIAGDNVSHALDMYTVAKREFIQALQEKILQPRGLDYRLQFPAPTGTNAIEAALKLARKVKGRTGVFSFQGGFHGMTLGALAATGNKYNRGGAGQELGGVTFMPYPFGFMSTFDTIQYIETVLTDPNSGIGKPAAIVLETVQAEGGIVVAPVEWLQRLRKLCDDHDILMIVDDIQVGCGRTGTFFSFERAGIVPDIVTLSKSISGYGIPLSVVLLKPELDKWGPGEHNGTFRGNQMAFVGGKRALEIWEEENVAGQVKAKAELITDFLNQHIASLDTRIQLRGLGMIRGIDLSALNHRELPNLILERCFQNGLIIEDAGRFGQVIKMIPPLVIPEAELLQGLNILKEAMEHYLKR
ncbi:Diaminobutyrate--2-oxoglutarate transaminase [gamma proteobacterium HdN1]|nr:Diaminobutyrate--2-oxoglutarate transaminase [gamma proteobacterium HdN1]